MANTQPQKYRVVSQNQQPVFNERGTPVTMFHVVFVVGEDGPFTVDFSAADFTTENVRHRLTQVADVVIANRGQ
jgi:hypothetical protein